MTASVAMLIGVSAAVTLLVVIAGGHELWFRYRMWKSERQIAAVRRMMRDASERRKGVHP